ncbi:MAG: hypothetical protein R3A79_01150 [Nannocystaceae bacterium]
MFEVLGFLAALVPTALMVVLAFYMTAREKRMLTVEKLNPAFTIPPMATIRADPERWLAEMRGKVTVICLGIAPEGAAEGGGAGLRGYASFLIDCNGEAHDLERGRWEDVDVNARWLADALDVRYEINA